MAYSWKPLRFLSVTFPADSPGLGPPPFLVNPRFPASSGRLERSGSGVGLGQLFNAFLPFFSVAWAFFVIIFFPHLLEVFFRGVSCVCVVTLFYYLAGLSSLASIRLSRQLQMENFEVNLKN